MWSPTGHLLFVRERNLMAQTFDLDKLALSGEPVPIVENVETGSNRNTAAFSISTGGISNLPGQRGVGHDATRLAWFDRQGKELEAIPGGENIFSQSLSPDAKTAAGTNGRGQPGRRTFGWSTWCGALLLDSRLILDRKTRRSGRRMGNRIAYVKTTNTEAADSMVKNAAGVGRGAGTVELRRWRNETAWRLDARREVDLLYTEGEARAAIMALPVGERWQTSGTGAGEPIIVRHARAFSRRQILSLTASNESGQSEDFCADVFSRSAREQWRQMADLH